MAFKGSQALGLDAGQTALSAIISWATATGIIIFIARRVFRRNPRNATIIVAIFSLITLVLWGATTDFANHWFEMNVVRSNVVHGFFQTSKGKTKVPWHSYLLVHQQIPRTGGDSMRTHLFNDIDLELQGIWLSNPDAPPRPWPPKLNDSITNILERSGKIIKGYLNRVDLKRIKRETKRFVFLREPVERALSFFNYVSREEKDPLIYFNLSSSYHLVGRTDTHMRSFVENAMTWQLGYHMHMNHRNISAEEAFQRAKQWLITSDFVGFYENFASDFLRLKQQLFSDVQVPWYYPFFFWLGTAFGLPRLRVKRLSARTSSEVLSLVRAINEWDIKLYDWARKQFSQEYTLYSNYGEFVGDNVALIFLVFILLFGFIGLICFGVVQCITFCIRSSPSDADRRTNIKAV